MPHDAAPFRGDGSSSSSSRQHDMWDGASDAAAEGHMSDGSGDALLSSLRRSEHWTPRRGRGINLMALGAMAGRSVAKVRSG